MFSTLWILIQLYPLQMMLVGLCNWVLGYWVGRAILRRELHKRLARMTDKYLTAQAAANCWKDEVEELAQRVPED